MPDESSWNSTREHPFLSHLWVSGHYSVLPRPHFYYDIVASHEAWTSILRFCLQIFFHRIEKRNLFTLPSDYLSNILYFFYDRLFKNPRSYTTSKKCPEFFPRILAQKLSYSEHKFSIRGLENFRQVLILIFPNSNKLLIIHRLEPFSAKNSCFSILIGPRPLSDPRVEERRAWLDRVFATRSESPGVKVEGSSRTAIVVRIRGVWED